MIRKISRDSLARQAIHSWRTNCPQASDKAWTYSEAGPCLRALLKQLDVAPCDGILTIVEIRNALGHRSRYFSPVELSLLHLLEKYYLLIKELSNDEPGPDRGISGNDLAVLQQVLEQEAAAPNY